MALFQSKQVIANKAMATARDGASLVPITGEFVIPAGFANNDIVEMACLPAYHIPVDLIVHVPDVDTNGSPTATFDYGVITGRFGDPVLGSRACGNEFGAGVVTPRTGGVDRTTKSLSAINASTSDRGVGIKVSAAIATLATGGVVRFTLLCEPAYLQSTIA